VFVIALGGSRVSVTAKPGFDVASVPVVSTPSSFVSSPGVSSTRRPSGGITSSSPTSASPSVAATKPKAATVKSSPIAATFDGLGGQAMLGVLGAGLLFFGFRRVADDIVDRAPTICPLDST
jgi:hypothetical protein